MSRFLGRTVIVTGAALGLGRAIVHAFAAAGAQVWGCDILAEGLTGTASTAPAPVHLRQGNVADSGQMHGVDRRQ